MNLVHLVHNYGYIAVFVGTFLEGETVLLAAAYAAHRGYLDPGWGLALAVAGSFLGDQTFFWIGRKWGSRLIQRFPKLVPGIYRMDALLHRYNLPVIAFMRFLYGLRIAGPIAIGMSRIDGQRFLLLNLLSATAWAITIGAVGYGIGAGTNYLVADFYRNDELVLATILSFGFALLAGLKWRSLTPFMSRLRAVRDSPSARFQRIILVECKSPSCRALWGGCSALLAFGIVALHGFAGSHPALFVLLLLPTLIATVRLGLGYALAIAIFGAGSMLWLDLGMVTTMSPLMLTFNALLRLSVFALVAWGGWKIVELSRTLQTLCHSDSLTGLGNHRAFMNRGEEEIQRARRGLLPLSVLFIDLDNFKAVNDNSGHHEGDVLLKRVATILAAHLRYSDFVARLGGDEFGLILYDTAGPGALRVAVQIHTDLRASFERTGHPVTASIGAVTFQDLPERFEDVVKRADALMYEVKRGSKDAVLHKVI